MTHDVTNKCNCLIWSVTRERNATETKTKRRCIFSDEKIKIKKSSYLYEEGTK